MCVPGHTVLRDTHQLMRRLALRGGGNRGVDGRDGAILQGRRERERERERGKREEREKEDS